MGRSAPALLLTCKSHSFLPVVTGASDGIGREFAVQLGLAGFNVLLVARNSKMLNDVAAEIGSSSTYRCRIQAYIPF
jgi:17beta-estradiol 17-dehydrogenase / very-long-chain 3-oxoacyl-CoA reductase